MAGTQANSGEPGLGIRIAVGALVVKKYAFDTESVRIGRDPGCEVFLPDAGISRLHLSIHRSQGQYRAVDNGSSNGTLLNGRGIDEAPLTSGDMLIIGRFRIWIEVFDPLVKPFTKEDWNKPTIRATPPEGQGDS